MPIPRPPRGIRWILTQTATYDILIALFALDPGVMEWMAVPIYGTDRQLVQGVLFLDSTIRGFFTPERQEIVLAAVRGIAVFIGKRCT